MRQALALILPLGFAIASPAAAEATRTLRVQLQGDPAQPFAVENLAGTMRVVPGSGDTLVAVATVHAENDELAQSMRFEQVRGEKGVPTLRVRYPVERHSVYRYGGRAKDGSRGFLDWISGGAAGGNHLEYDDHRVSVSGSRGVVLYADVEVQVPRKAIDAHFRNHVGPISGQGVEGKAKFDTGSGDVTISDTKGQIVADTGSGNVRASGVEGSFACDTGSGECNVNGFKGDKLTCDTGSGTVRVRAIDTEEFAADTGSGDVELAVEGSRLARVSADTGSGTVRLRLGPEASFEVHASTGSGDVVSRYSDAEAIVRGKEIVGYRRGDGHIRINVETGSGDVVLEPR